MLGSCKLERLQATIRCLSEAGLDVISILNSMPSLFTLSVSKSLKPKVHYILHRMGRDRAELDSYYICLTRSLEGRIKPRHLFLGDVRSSSVKLGAMLCTTDERFATKVAGRTLEEYQQFRRERGLPASGPPRWQKRT